VGDAEERKERAEELREEIAELEEQGPASHDPEPENLREFVERRMHEQEGETEDDACEERREPA
jgi:hypothetical protein